MISGKGNKNVEEQAHRGGAGCSFVMWCRLAAAAAPESIDNLLVRFASLPLRRLARSRSRRILALDASTQVCPDILGNTQEDPDYRRIELAARTTLDLLLGVTLLDA
jgi:hypothetical protein